MTRRIAGQRQRLCGGQSHAGGRKVGLNRKLAPSPVHQHRQLHPGRTAIVKKLIEHGADGASGVEHIVKHQDIGAVHRKGQLGLPACRQTALGIVVAVHHRRHLPGLTVQTQIPLQPLGQPGTARGDAHEAGIGLAQTAHAAQQLLVQGLCIQSQGTHGMFLKNRSRMMAAAAASASLAPSEWASVVV